MTTLESAAPTTPPGPDPPRDLRTFWRTRHSRCCCPCRCWPSASRYLLGPVHEDGSFADVDRLRRDTGRASTNSATGSSSRS